MNPVKKNRANPVALPYLDGGSEHILEQVLREPRRPPRARSAWRVLPSGLGTAYAISGRVLRHLA